MNTLANEAGINLDHTTLDPIATERITTERPDTLLHQPARATATTAAYSAPTENLRRPAQPASRPGRSPIQPGTALVGSVEPQLLPGHLIDALIEAVVLPPDPGARSAVVCSLVHELCTALEWLDGDETIRGEASNEALSIQQLASAAQDHHQRMTQSQQAGW